MVVVVVLGCNLGQTAGQGVGQVAAVRAAQSAVGRLDRAMTADWVSRQFLEPVVEAAVLVV